MPIIKGLRTDFSGKINEVDLEWAVRTGHDKKLWVHILNGPTGYESMPLASCIEAIEKQKTWAACMGSHVYDKLMVPWEELQKLLNTPVVELLKHEY
jgi:hypothetical protein